MSKFIESNGKVSKEVIAFLRQLGIPISENHTVIEVEKAIELNQPPAPSAQERWEMDLPEKYKAKANFIITQCHDLFDMDKTIFPQHDSYNAILLLGTTFEGVFNRTSYYLELIEKNKIDPEIKIYALTGERMLFNTERPNEIASILKLKQQPYVTNEYEMMQLVLRNMLPGKEISYIYSGKDPKHTRATTASTLVKFLKDTKITNGRFLAISNQPYVAYQQSVLNLVLKQNNLDEVIIDVVGKETDTEDTSSKEHYAAVLLDTFFKIIYHQAQAALLTHKD